LMRKNCQGLPIRSVVCESRLPVTFERRRVHLAHLLSAGFLSNSNGSHSLRAELEQSSSSHAMRDLQEEVRHSERARLLLSERNKKGVLPYHPYAKWCGAHWVLSLLAD